VKWYHAVTVAKEVKKLRERARYYVITTVPTFRNKPKDHKLDGEGRKIKSNCQ